MKRIAFALLMVASTAQAETVITKDTVLTEDLFDNVVIAADDITLDCNGYSIINPIPMGPPLDGIEVDNRSGVTIRDCRVTGFFRGIDVVASSVQLVDVTLEANTLSGLEASDNSRLLVSGNFNLVENGVFGGFLINDVAMTMVAANANIQGNTAGLQVSLNSSLFVAAFAPVPPSTILAQKNQTFGLQAASNSHVFLFGAVSVVTRENGSNGLSVFTKSSIEFDNGPMLTAENNGQNGILLEDSSLNMFNMPGNPGSSLVLRDNGLSGVSASKLSVFDMGNDATMVAEGNRVGLTVDFRSIATVSGSTLTGNNEDVRLTFGSAAEFVGNSIGLLVCDGTALIRGDEACPSDGTR